MRNINITKINDKPIIIHTKQKTKIHSHEPKNAVIVGSNIYTVNRSPKIKEVAGHKEVATWSDEMNSYYKDCIIDRTRLFEFMEMNDWFDLHVKYLSQREKLLLREKPFLMRSQDIQQLRGRIEIWLSAYKKTNYEKLKILEGLGKRLVPATTKAYISFLIERKVQNEQSSWQLLDYLLGVLHKELIDLSDEEIEELLNHMETEIPLTTSMLFASFYENIQ